MKYLKKRVKSKKNNFLYELRIENNLSQIEMSELLGVVQPTISKIESGFTKNLEFKVVKALREQFGINIDELIDSGAL